jgi:hypothetical protein
VKDGKFENAHTISFRPKLANLTRNLQKEVSLDTILAPQCKYLINSFALVSND